MDTPKIITLLSFDIRENDVSYRLKIGDELVEVTFLRDSELISCDNSGVVHKESPEAYLRLKLFARVALGRATVISDTEEF